MHSFAGLRSIDRLLSWLVIVGGLAQWALTPRFFPTIHEPAAWWFNGGTTLILLGGLNLLRISDGSVAPNIRRFAIAANLALSAFYVALLLGLWYKFVRYPFSFIGPVVLFTLTLVSLRGGWRAHEPA